MNITVKPSKMVMRKRVEFTSVVKLKLVDIDARNNVMHENGEKATIDENQEMYPRFGEIE